MANVPSRDQLITKYFKEGYKYKEIVLMLSNCYGIKISVTQLKRILKKLNLNRRNCVGSSVEEVCTVMINELEGSGSCLGYKALWRRLIQEHGLIVKRQIVLDILRIADPEGIAARAIHRLKRRKYKVPGPNFLWHVDGYDKLKPYGFAIHGGIDGFSRKVLWLEVASTNNNPSVIARYYLNAVSNLGIVPTLLRTDKGTENVNIECLQISLRMYHADKLSGYRSYMVGKSTSNQRIECFWAQLRKMCTNYWMNTFKDLRDTNIINDADPFNIHCVRYCFGPLIQKDLARVKTEWNTHNIRKQKNCDLLHGKPNVLYYAPEKYNSRDYGKVVDENDINVCLDKHSESPVLYPHVFDELVDLLLPDENTPTNVEEATELYLKIIEAVKQHRQNNQN